MILKGRDENTCSQDREMDNIGPPQKMTNLNTTKTPKQKDIQAPHTRHPKGQEKSLGGGFYTAAEQEEECLRLQANTEPKMF